MTKFGCEGNKNDAKWRVNAPLVLRAITRFKSFKILKYFLPIAVLHSCDDIIRICAIKNRYYLKILQQQNDICYFVTLFLLHSQKRNSLSNNCSHTFLAFDFWAAFCHIVLETVCSKSRVLDLLYLKRYLVLK